VAIVGSRAPTAAGLRHAAGFARALAEAGLVVTSGLASGVDAAAHRAALAAGGASIGVIGCGPDRAFPAGHAALQASLEREGLLVAEDPPGTPPDAWRFPRRNRVIAGLALGTLVVEAAQRSGALITGRLAAEAGREVFALPGAIDNLKARGCHALIRQGAALVESPGEVAEALAEAARRLAGALRGGPSAAPGPAPGLPVAPPPADPRQRLLWASLADGPLPAESLAARAGLTMGEASSILLLMELEGHVVADGGRYLRKP
jgi:DNA processing protein